MLELVGLDFALERLGFLKLFDDEAVLCRVVPGPAVVLPLVVERERREHLFVGGNRRAGEFRADFARALEAVALRVRHCAAVLARALAELGRRGRRAAAAALVRVAHRRNGRTRALRRALVRKRRAAEAQIPRRILDVLRDVRVDVAARLVDFRRRIAGLARLVKLLQARVI